MARHGKTPITAFLIMLAGALMFAPVPARSQSAWVEPEAVRQLDNTLDFMGKLKTFSVNTLNTLEEIIEPGQKIQLDFAATLTLQRPAGLRVERHGEVVNQALYYDGKMLTLYDTASNYYAQTPAPESIEGMLDFARLSLGLEAPLSDLLYRDVLPLLLQNVHAARVVGKTDIGGARCVHLAFSRPDVDFQIWVAEGDKPLPCKYVVTDKNSFGQPSYTVVMSGWNLSPEIGASTFSFSAPQGSTSTGFMLLDSNGNFAE